MLTESVSTFYLYTNAYSTSPGTIALGSGATELSNYSSTHLLCECGYSYRLSYSRLCIHKLCYNTLCVEHCTSHVSNDFRCQIGAWDECKEKQSNLL